MNANHHSLLKHTLHTEYQCAIICNLAQLRPAQGDYITYLITMDGEMKWSNTDIASIPFYQHASQLGQTEQVQGVWGIYSFQVWIDVAIQFGWNERRELVLQQML